MRASANYDETAEGNAKKIRSLILLGCPEVPVQTSMAMYLTNLLKESQSEVVIAGTGAAIKLMKFADPQNHYLEESMNLDRCIEAIAEGRLDFDLCFAFAHNDAGITYAATMSYISKAKLFLVIFGRNAEEISKTVDFDCHKLVAKAVHNPTPLKRQIDEVVSWAVSRT